MTVYDAPAYAQRQRDGSRAAALDKRVGVHCLISTGLIALRRVTDLDRHPSRDHAGGDGHRFRRHIGRGLFRVHQQVQKYLLELSLRAQNESGFRCDTLLQTQSQRFPFRFAKLREPHQQSVDIEVPRFGILGPRKRHQAGHDLGGALRFPCQQSQVALRHDFLVMRRQRRRQMQRQVQNHFERRAQLVRHARNQLTRGGQLFAAEQLFAHRALLLQLQRGRHLVRQMLDRCLLLNREISQPVCVSSFQHPQHRALRRQRQHHCRTGRALFRARMHIAAAPQVGNVQMCSILKANRGAVGQIFVGLRFDRHHHRLRIGFRGDALQRFRAPVINIQPRRRRLCDCGKNRHQLFGDFRRGGRRDNLLAKRVERSHRNVLVFDSTAANPPHRQDHRNPGERDQCDQRSQPRPRSGHFQIDRRSQHDLKIAIERCFRRILRHQAGSGDAIAHMDSSQQVVRHPW